MDARMIRQVAGALVLMLAMALCASTEAGDYAKFKGGGDDIVPSAPPGDFSWVDHGDDFTAPLMDADNKMQIFQTQAYQGVREYKAGSPKVRDSTGKHYPRMYFQSDYNAVQKVSAARYWAARFGASDTPAKMTVHAGPGIDPISIRWNCYQFAMKSTCAGHWEALIGSGEMPDRAIPTALEASATGELRENAVANDILLYTEGSGGIPVEVTHAGVLIEVDGQPVIQFRFGGSQVFRYAVGSTAGAGFLGTPAYYSAAGFPMVPGTVIDRSDWNWDPTAAGSENRLHQNKVWRPK